MMGPIIATVIVATLAGERSAELGPVSVTLRADTEQVTVGQPFTLTLEVTAEPGVDVRVPTYLDKIGEFDVLDARTPPDIPDGDLRRWTHTYTLSTFSPESVEIPEITITFVETAPEEQQLTVGPLPIVVETILGDFNDDARAAALTVDDAVPVPAPPWPWLLWIGFAAGGLLLGGGVGFLLWLLLRPRRARAHLGDRAARPAGAGRSHRAGEAARVLLQAQRHRAAVHRATLRSHGARTDHRRVHPRDA
jgi:hypothetical protein